MGWNGIGIGWPNASNQQTVMGYFTFEANCNGSPIIEGLTSQLINISTYNVGDFVDYIDNKGSKIRYQIGGISMTPGDQIIEISGPAYSSCQPLPFTGYFGFVQYCGGRAAEQTYYGPTTQTWQIGQVVINADFPSETAYVIINSIVPDLGGEWYPFANLQGPALNGCPVL
jgi:hypothetical protein